MSPLPELFFAVARGDCREVERLLAAGADPVDEDRCGSNPGHWAAAYGHKECLVALVDRGWDPRRRDMKGRSALDLARGGEGCESCILFLEEIVASLDLRDQLNAATSEMVAPAKEHGL